MSPRNTRATWAHPRSRGADHEFSLLDGVSRGSSPLARGGHPLGKSPGSSTGLIPARAGRTHSQWEDEPTERLIPARAERTSPAAADVGILTAHPRSRGADTRPPSCESVGPGSSPLARGGRRPDAGACSSTWLIPARAGRTVLVLLLQLADRAHPRSRGADTGVPVTMNDVDGSSPLARGGHRYRACRAKRRRLIPARAGRTTRLPHGPRPSWAHPRSRGADEVWAPGDGAWVGSSPLARGGLNKHHLTFFLARLIPARAGRTKTLALSSSVNEAHPRSRGADGQLEGVSPWDTGSSPLARGGLCISAILNLLYWLIPARAGRTDPAARGVLARQAHPRSRGADALTQAVAHGWVGSSPLARGGLLPRGRPRASWGLIPARAGRTLWASLRAPFTAAHPRSRGADT